MITIKVKMVNNKKGTAASEDKAPERVKAETAVSKDPVEELVKRLQEDALSGDLFPNTAARVETAARYLEEYKARVDKACCSNKYLLSELAKSKNQCARASEIIFELSEEKEALAERVTELENLLKKVFAELSIYPERGGAK